MQKANRDKRTANSGNSPYGLSLMANPFFAKSSSFSITKKSTLILKLQVLDCKTFIDEFIQRINSYFKMIR